MVEVDSAEVTLDPDPTSVGRARRWLSRQLEEWGLEDLDYDASVVLSELVTNSILHARTPVTLRVTRSRALRLEVFDSSPILPTLRGAGAETTTGRGLHLVGALASAWGSEPRQGGKVVWAEFSEAGGAGGRSGRSGGGSGRPSVSLLEHREEDGPRPRLRKSA